ncbi:unnamed protein product, partial [Candidula unifasciata]
AALGCGFFIAAIVSSLSNVSGAHLNPAVSIAFLVTRQITFTRKTPECTVSKIKSTTMIAMMIIRRRRMIMLDIY